MRPPEEEDNDDLPTLDEYYLDMDIDWEHPEPQALEPVGTEDKDG